MYDEVDLGMQPNICYFSKIKYWEMTRNVSPHPFQKMLSVVAIQGRTWSTNSDPIFHLMFPLTHMFLKFANPHTKTSLIYIKNICAYPSTHTPITLGVPWRTKTKNFKKKEAIKQMSSYHMLW